MLKPMQFGAMLGVFMISAIQAWASPFDESLSNKNPADSGIQIGGVYPHLTMRNAERECSTGAIVPWQGDLWAITYAPHRIKASSFARKNALRAA